MCETHCSLIIGVPELHVNIRECLIFVYLCIAIKFLKQHHSFAPNFTLQTPTKQLKWSLSREGQLEETYSHWDLKTSSGGNVGSYRSLFPKVFLLLSFHVRKITALNLFANQLFSVLCIVIQTESILLFLFFYTLVSVPQFHSSTIWVTPEKHKGTSPEAWKHLLKCKYVHISFLQCNFTVASLSYRQSHLRYSQGLTVAFSPKNMLIHVAFDRLWFRA